MRPDLEKPWVYLNQWFVAQYFLQKQGKQKNNWEKWKWWRGRDIGGEGGLRWALCNDPESSGDHLPTEMKWWSHDGEQVPLEGIHAFLPTPFIPNNKHVSDNTQAEGCAIGSRLRPLGIPMNQGLKNILFLSTCNTLPVCLFLSKP